MDMIQCEHGNYSECDLCGDIVKRFFVDMETASEPVQNALYAAGFTTEQCDLLADGILQYIKDYGLSIVKTNVNKTTSEPEKIYLHDPHGYFEEDYSGECNTVVWSEDRISENDYEYVRASKIFKNKGVINVKKI